MKKVLFSILAFSFFTLTNAQPPEGLASAGMNFGAKVTADAAIDINELDAALKGKESVDIKIKGKVVEVCQKEGCWIKMETKDGKIMVKMNDHAFLVPLDMNGKTIVVEGNAKMKTTSVAELKHYAEDAGKSKKEIAKIKEPKKEISFNALGILVL